MQSKWVPKPYTDSLQSISTWIKLVGHQHGFAHLWLGSQFAGSSSMFPTWHGSCPSENTSCIVLWHSVLFHPETWQISLSKVDLSFWTRSFQLSTICTHNMMTFHHFSSAHAQGFLQQWKFHYNKEWGDKLLPPNTSYSHLENMLYRDYINHPGPVQQSVARCVASSYNSDWSLEKITNMDRTEATPVLVCPRNCLEQGESQQQYFSSPLAIRIGWNSI